MSLRPASKGPAPRPLCFGAGRECWIISALGDDERVKSFSSASDTLYLRAVDGREVTFEGSVTFSTVGPRSGHGPKLQPGTVRHRLEWRSSGAATARSLDGTVIAEFMELLAIDRSRAPDWLLTEIMSAKADRDESPLASPYYELLLARGAAADTAAGHWGTWDFEEWRHRPGARDTNGSILKFFAIQCVIADRPGPRRAQLSDIVGMCQTVAPHSYYVCVRSSSVRRIGDRLGVDVEVEAGRVPPADWIPRSMQESARFEIAAPLGLEGRSTLVVPAGRRSGTQHLQFDVDADRGPLSVTVFDDRKQRYDLPIDLP